jgi:hypothetical protein
MSQAGIRSLVAHAPRGVRAHRAGPRSCAAAIAGIRLATAAGGIDQA